MKNNYKKGVSFIEVLIATILISMLASIVLGTTKMFVYGMDSRISSEINIVSHSYVNIAKSECSTASFTNKINNITIMNNIPIKIVSSCQVIDPLKPHLYLITVDCTYKGGSKHEETYFYL
jgi:prepilin-type N-terminal cleavage/methylation domain-containing protein